MAKVGASCCNINPKLDTTMKRPQQGKESKQIWCQIQKGFRCLTSISFNEIERPEYLGGFETLLAKLGMKSIPNSNRFQQRCLHKFNFRKICSFHNSISKTHQKSQKKQLVLG